MTSRPPQQAESAAQGDRRRPDPPVRIAVQAAAAQRVAPSRRREELLELAYRHVLANGLADMSLRPLAKAIGSSPRVLIYLFDSKDNLVRALLERARTDELAAIDTCRPSPPSVSLASAAAQVWVWLSAPERRNLLTLWVEAYARSLVEPSGPWQHFARQTVQDWLDLLASCQSPERRRTAQGAAERTAVLAFLRGALLDLLATGDVARTTLAVTGQLERLA